MEKREKVFKGLTCHVQENSRTRCHKCPYWGTGPHGLSECSKLAADALALLKAQEPRVMTLEELRKYSGPVWVEWRDKRYEYDNGWEVATFTENYAAEGETYNGKEYRYWTAKPTDEQREATPWN